MKFWSLDNTGPLLDKLLISTSLFFDGILANTKISFHTDLKSYGKHSNRVQLSYVFWDSESKTVSSLSAVFVVLLTGRWMDITGTINACCKSPRRIFLINLRFCLSSNPVLFWISTICPRLPVHGNFNLKDLSWRFIVVVFLDKAKSQSGVMKRPATGFNWHCIVEGRCGGGGKREREREGGRMRCWLSQLRKKKMTTTY